mmetsp:Transcript_25883/g.26325  ORF Transcript_25883/g.26325 Transcript_25883/m.26325 type:complete len:99 (+) Transcript_25883:2796-3092(+)
MSWVDADLSVAVADSPPRILRTNNGNDNGEVVEIDFVVTVAVAAVMAVTASNFAHNKQTNSSEQNVTQGGGDILNILDGDGSVEIDEGNETRLSTIPT